jgi:dTDP-glucose pyrophosphorylase
MAGSGSRFRDAGYALPKPFIDVNGKAMIMRVIENIHVAGARVVLIARTQDVQAYPELFAALKASHGCDYVTVDALTEGAACTVLTAARYFDNDTPMLIANSDQLVDVSIQAFIDDAKARRLDGSILTFVDPESNPKWSFAAVDASGRVTETREKKPISPHATVGVYWFAKGAYFAQAARDMIAANDRHNNEFYVCPAYNYLISRGQNIGIYGIDYAQMHGLGTPEDLQRYLARVG